MKKSTVAIITAFIAFSAGMTAGSLLQKNSEGKAEKAIEVKTGTTPADDYKLPATRIVDGILKGIKGGDYKTFSTDFHQIMLSAVPEAVFNQQKATFNILIEDKPKPQWLGFYDKAGTITTLFKIKARDGSDTLVTLSIIKVNEDWKVVGCYLQ